jgi:predicted SprT family Zn-dependent metalloprotease
VTPLEAGKLAKKFVAKWQHIATTYCWQLDIYYHGQAREMPAGQDDVLGYSYGRYHYLDGGVHLNLELLADMDEDEIEYVIVHEFCHFLLFPSQKNNSSKEIELCVTMIARTILDMQCPDPKAHKKK